MKKSKNESEEPRRSVKLEFPADSSMMNTTPGEDRFQDRLDVVKHSLEVHSKPSKIGKDLVLSNFDENERTYIAGMHKCAFMWQQLIKSKKFGEKGFQALSNEGLMISVLKRNQVLNPILRGIYFGQTEEEENNARSGSWTDKIKDAIFGQKKAEGS